MYKRFVSFVRELYGTADFIPLHEPRFIGREKEYLLDTIDSTFVSSVGSYVDKFEASVAKFTGAKYAIATVNGTAALHIALKLAGVEKNTEVITQSLTFVATCNAVRYCGAEPVFVDVDLSTLGLSPDSLKYFLEKYCEIRDDGFCWNKQTNRKVVACLPMHTLGFPVQLDEIQVLCKQFNLTLVEDAAEALGSYYKNQHVGIQSDIATISFNGNKIITTGGGGMILTNDKSIAKKAKHITTTAKVPHSWYFEHDEVGYNYRLPNLNAALGVAQMEVLPAFIKSKRELAGQYQAWGNENGMQFVIEPAHVSANYWLNSVICESVEQRDAMLEETNAQSVMTRPSWEPMHCLRIYEDCPRVELGSTEWLHNRLINVPSSIVT